MAINKNDAQARRLFGAAYDAIPKSTFAAAAYFLAQICSEGEGDELRRLAEEIETLAQPGNGFVLPEQAKRAVAALKAEI